MGQSPQVGYVLDGRHYGLVAAVDRFTEYCDRMKCCYSDQLDNWYKLLEVSISNDERATFFMATSSTLN